MSSSASELAAGTKVGEYEIVRPLGSGGMGTLYEAVHPVIGKRAAVKVIKASLAATTDMVDRFVQEARAVNQIGHPNIVDVFAFGDLSDGRPYLVMELLQGQSLAARIEREPLSLAEIATVVEQVCHALEAAHAAGIVHRDLKPDNVFLAEVPGGEPRVKLLDFGIAKLSNDLDMRSERTRSGVLLGTPLYIAPEQARGLDVDGRTDVYSLGAMIFEMATGRPPFNQKSGLEVIAAHLDKPPPSLRETESRMPVALDRLVTAMMAKQPEARPTLPAVRKAMVAMRAAPEVPVAARRVWPWVVAGVLVLGGGGLGVMMMRGGARQEESPPPPAPAVVTPVVTPVVPPDAGVPDAAARPLPPPPPPPPPPRKKPATRPVAAPPRHEEPVEKLNDRHEQPLDPFK